MRGLSQARCHVVFGVEEQCRAALKRLHRRDDFFCTGCGHRRPSPLATRSFCQCSIRASVSAGQPPSWRERSSMRQAASCDLVRGHPADRDGEERHLVGGTRPLSCYRVANGLDHEAEDNGGDGPTRGGVAAPGRVEIDDACLWGGGTCGRPCRAADTKPSLAAVSAPTEGRQRKVADVGRDFAKASDRVRRQATTDLRNGGCNGRPRRLERARRVHVQPPGNLHRAGPGSGPHGTVPMMEFDARKYRARDNGTYREVEPDSKLHAWRSSHQSHALLRDHRGMTFVIKLANL